MTPDIRERVTFRTHNLLQDCRAFGKFDVIFCRNVLIYFDDATKSAVLSRLAAQLAPDGYLVLGAAETTTNHSNEFMAVPENRPGVFCFTAAASLARAREERPTGANALPRAPHRSKSRRAEGSSSVFLGRARSDHRTFTGSINGHGRERAGHHRFSDFGVGRQAASDSSSGLRST